MKEQKQSFRTGKPTNGCVRAKTSQVPEKPSINQMQPQLGTRFFKSNNNIDILLKRIVGTYDGAFVKK